jgi:uncharacterized protein
MEGRRRSPGPRSVVAMTVASSHEQFAVRFERNVPVPMRDGTVLYADVYAPAREGRHPVLLQRTPYNKELSSVIGLAGDPLVFAGAGYVVVVQDSRGRWTSEGEFYPFRDEALDGYDTVEWCAAQPWSSGQVGMVGVSYVALAQWYAASAKPPHLRAILPILAGSSAHEGWTYRGGAFELNFNLSLTLLFFAGHEAQRLGEAGNGRRDGLYESVVSAIDRLPDLFRRRPLVDQPALRETARYYLDWLQHPAADAYWSNWDLAGRYARLELPVFHVGGWYDTFIDGTLKNFVGMRTQAQTEAARTAQKLVIGPWSHGQPWLASTVGDVDFGFSASATAIGLQAMQLRWCDRWLKGIAGDEEAPVQLFVMGTNAWREESEWPLARTRWVEYFLHSDGRAHVLESEGVLSRDRPGDEPVDTYVYNPRDPVPTRGGGLCCSPLYSRGGAFDQRGVERRPDVLTYASAILTEDLEVTGPIVVRLWASSSAPDTDWTAKLVDVGPEFARNLTDGIVRARYRQAPDRETMLEPGEISRYELRLSPTSNVFRRGNRIRLEISSSNFPRFDPNTNTGGEQATEVRSRVAQQRIYHDAEHPSHILLPVIPAR